MRTTLLAGAALAVTLVVSTLWSSAEAISAPDLKSALGPTGAVTLVGHGGGGMDGGGGGGRVGLGGGSSRAFGAGAGSRAFSSRSFSGSSSHFKSGYMTGSNITGRRTFSKRSFDNGPSVKGHDKFVGNNWKGGKNLHDHDNKRLAMRDHDHDFNHFNRHRVFRNGAWVWLYGPGYYSGDDCWWLLRQARVTGSSYWWSRYDACVSYY